jgi:hypothetical protein
VKPQNSSERSFRLDCCPILATPPPPPSGHGGGDVKCKEDEDLTLENLSLGARTGEPYLPGSLYLRDAHDVHLESRFQHNDDSLPDLLDTPSLLLYQEHVPYRRYGTHHQAVATLKSAVLSECPICTMIRESIGNLSWSELEDAKAFDSGFTTYGIYYFPENTDFWVIFHIGLSNDHPGLSFDIAQTVLHLLCRPQDRKRILILLLRVN